MPEGHTIHRIAKDHSELLVGQPIRVSSPQGRFAFDAATIDGQTLDRIEAYGKHLFYWWSNGLVGHVHLGLFGRFRTVRAPATATSLPTVRMRLATNEVTVDLSGPTDCSVDGGEKRESIVARLGPDPLRADARPQLAVAAIRRSKQAIGALLLQQNVIAGIGNVYRAEALFVEGIHPQRPGASLSDDELQSLWSTVSAMLRQGVRDNRIITVDRSLLPQGRARRGEATYVYHRDTCLRCGSQVRTVRLAARDCYFCPQCQRT